ncbi:MAG: SDR family oxidoreductase [Pseudomonadota bacterium]
MAEGGVFSGRCVLITGAASGIGRVTALAFAAERADVILADRGDMAGVLAEITAIGGTATAVPTDVADPGSVDALFARAAALDVVVNCAGIWVEGSILEMPPEDFDRQIGVNLKGSFLIAQGAARAMAARDAADSGRLILIASELAHLGRKDVSAYCASKAGVIGLTRALARECAPGILVNAVAPGPIDTPMLDLPSLAPDKLAEELTNPLGRVGQPEEIAAVILFLAGPGGTLMTGQTVCPSGGAVML